MINKDFTKTINMEKVLEQNDLKVNVINKLKY
jgi:hypothetical protein